MTTIEADFVGAYPVRFLDVTPMIEAFQFQPADFEFKHGWLRHVPSRHQFRFDRKGRVTIDARCSCAAQAVSREQGERLYAAFNGWHEYYWRPLEIDREFASHFREPNAWVRLFRDFRMAWRRFRRQAAPISLPSRTMGIAPAE